MAVTRTTTELRAEGYGVAELARMTRVGELNRIRRGAYVTSADLPQGPAALHLELIGATLPLTHDDAVVSHHSAAVVHGFPLFADDLRRVQVTRTRRGGRKRSTLHLHAAQLDQTEVHTVDGLRVTSPARTVVDIARAGSFERAVVVGDAALRSGLDTVLLQDCLQRSARRPGINRARRVCGFLNGASESPGESLSRVSMHTARVPPPRLQYEVWDGPYLIGRSDFSWPEHRTLGEFDGKIKYGRLLKPGETPQDAVYREKLREDALRDQGWQVVRWTWDDLRDPKLLAARLDRAFHRNGPL